MEKIIIKADYGLTKGTSIITTYKQSEDREWVEEVQKTRKWGAFGKIIKGSHGHGFCYVVEHSDGSNSAYNPEELMSIDLLTKLRKTAQDFVRSLDLEVSFYNLFNKTNRKSRIVPDRFLICFLDSLEKRNTIFNSCVKQGYVCKKGKVYEIKKSNQDLQIEKFWTFQIDLFE